LGFQWIEPGVTQNKQRASIAKQRFYVNHAGAVFHAQIICITGHLIRWFHFSHEKAMPDISGRSPSAYLRKLAMLLLTASFDW
jgi:hypothetical protein